MGLVRAILYPNANKQLRLSLMLSFFMRSNGMSRHTYPFGCETINSTLDSGKVDQNKEQTIKDNHHLFTVYIGRQLHFPCDSLLKVKRHVHWNADVHKVSMGSKQREGKKLAIGCTSEILKRVDKSPLFFFSFEVIDAF